MNYNKQSTLVDESLMYERASGTFDGLIIKVAAEKAQNIKQALAVGEKPDVSYDIVLDMLKASQKKCEDKSNELWEQAERSAEIDKNSVDELCNAFLERAVLDYERAACGNGLNPRAVMDEIERFCDSIDSDVLRNILRKVDKAVPELKKVIKEHGAEIVAETNEVRKTRSKDKTDMTNKCPLCGYSLYEYGIGRGGVHYIKCSGCSMEGWYIENERQIKR